MHLWNSMYACIFNIVIQNSDLIYYRIWFAKACAKVVWVLKEKWCLLSLKGYTFSQVSQLFNATQHVVLSLGGHIHNSFKEGHWKYYFYIAYWVEDRILCLLFCLHGKPIQACPWSWQTQLEFIPQVNMWGKSAWVE